MHCEFQKNLHGYNMLLKPKKRFETVVRQHAPVGGNTNHTSTFYYYKPWQISCHLTDKKQGDLVRVGFMYLTIQSYQF